MLALIIFGTKGVTSSIAVGSFHCPGCGEKRRYEQKEVRRYFSLYFIPLIPLDRLGEYVECQSCQGTYKREVLDFEPGPTSAKVEAEFHAGMRRVMVLMMLADGAVDDAEVATIQRIYGKLTGDEIDRDDIDQEIAAAKSDGRDLAAWGKTMAGRLNDSGREMVVKAAVCVAAADGEFKAEEKKALAQLATALELPAPRFKAILSELTS